MTSRLITPPEKFNNENSYLIINALDAELHTLVYWLKTVPDEYDLYFYHDQMPEKLWPEDLAYSVKKVLVNKEYVDDLHDGLKYVLNDVKDRVVYFGLNTEYPLLLKYFLEESKKVDLF